MQKKHWLALLLLAGGGCSSMNNTEKDGLVGAGAGAGAMALLTRGNPVATAVGGLAGGLIGAFVGSGQDRVDNHQKAVAQAQAAYAADAARRQMPLQDIVQMSQTGVSDSIIIQQINTTGSWFNLTANDIVFLRDQRVSEAVISVMMSRRGPPPVMVAPGPYYGPPPGAVVVVDPGPPPPPPVAVGGEVFIGGGRRW